MPAGLSPKYWLVLALFLGLSLRVPGWFTQDHKASWQTFEPDEGQHVHIATTRFNDLYNGEKVGNYKDAPWNVRGYGHLMAYSAYGWYGLSGQVPSFAGFILLGRQLSTLFALLLIIVVYKLGRVSGLDPPAAAVAAFLMAACDVNATYSHYCLPASGYILWVYLALLGGFQLLRSPNVRAMIWLALGVAGALSFKFDVLPLGWGGLLLLYLAIQKRIPWYFIALALGLLAAFVIAFAYGWSWSSIQSTFQTLSELNRNGVPVDNHFRDNLIVYPAGVLAGIGLPVFVLAMYGVIRIVKAGHFGKLSRGRGTAGAMAPDRANGAAPERGGWQKQGFKRLILLYAAGWLLSEFLVRWSVDTAFVRRVNVFMPAVCLLAAYGLSRLRRRRPWLPAAVVTYTFLFALVGQSNHWFDTRYDMREWIATELPADATIAISNYVGHKGLRKTWYFMDVDWDYAVLHESYFRRYAKSMTTPFGWPNCETEIYNPGPEGQCEQMQALLKGTNPNVRLLKAFHPLELFPERWAYRQFFGYYETFLGETLVFERAR